MDGIVLFADTELTYPESLKHQGSTKVRTYENQGVAVALTGAGDWEYLRMAFENVTRRLPTAGNTSDEILDKIQETILEIYDTNIALYPNKPKPGFDLFAAVRSPDSSLALMKSADTAFSRTFKFEMSGVGKLLGVYLADLLYEPSISVKQGLFLAAYILRVANKYVAGVGGRSDVVTLNSSGKLQVSLGIEMDVLQEHFDRFDSILRPLLLAVPDVPDPFLSTAEAIKETQTKFDERLAEFVRNVKELRDQYEYEKSPFKF